MGHGGRRAGAGRKSNASIAHARQVFRSEIPEKRWRKIIDNLAHVAEDRQSQSAMEAFWLLAPYVSGVPTAKDSGEESEKEISVIRIIDPGENAPHPNDG